MAPRLGRADLRENGTIVRSWDARSVEQRTLFNPAYLAVLVTEAARGHQEERTASLPYPLAFLAAAIASHDSALEELPTSVSTSVFAWLGEHPSAQVRIASRAQELAPHTQEAIRLGLRHGALALQAPWGLEAKNLRPAPQSGYAKAIQRSRKVARFSGRWLGRAGDPGTVLSVWGLSV